MSLLAAAAQQHATTTTTTTTATTTTTTTAVDPLASDPYAPAPYTIPTAAPYNSPESLTIPTYDGSGQAVHPSVIDFGTTWNGWRYWMAMTPFPGSNDRYEDPSIVVSQNGYYWQVPDGLTNPLYPAPPAPGFNSDTHLTYDAASDELVLIFRTTTDNAHHDLYVVRSGDGVTWPAVRPTPITIPLGGEAQAVSPALIKVGNGDWRIWALGRTTRRMYMWTASQAEGPYSGPYQCVGTGSGGPWFNWHLDVQHIDGMFYATIDRGPLYLGSPDGMSALTSLDGMSWERAGSNIMDAPETGWDSGELYRASITPHSEAPGLMRVWYSARGPGSPSVWGTGYTEMPKSLWPTPPPLPAPGSGTTYRDEVLSDSPEILWRMGSDHTESTEPDLSGNNRDGTWVGGHSWGPSLSGDAGYSSSVEFGRLERGYESWMAASSFTVRVIVRPRVLSGAVASIYGPDGGWAIQATQYATFTHTGGDPVSFGMLSQNTDYHLAVVVDSGTISTYKNGALVNTGSGSPTVTSTARLVVAARFDGGTTYSQNHRGMLEYLDFVPAALSSAQILASAQAAGLA